MPERRGRHILEICDSHQRQPVNRSDHNDKAHTSLLKDHIRETAAACCRQASSAKGSTAVCFRPGLVVGLCHIHRLTTRRWIIRRGRCSIATSIALWGISSWGWWSSTISRRASIGWSPIGIVAVVSIFFMRLLPAVIRPSISGRWVTGSRGGRVSRWRVPAEEQH